MRVCITFLGLALLPLALAGCGQPPDARFVLSERTSQLSREARRAVEAQLTEHFGKPNELVAWERLPIQYGGTTGSVVEVLPSDDGSTVLKVALDADSLTLQPNSHLVWNSGVYHGSEGRIPVREFEPSNNELVIGAKFPAPPAVGDHFAIDPGAKFIQAKRLYLTHCMHCHGVSGDGAGPTAKYLNPLPRDYRLGVFKFTSTIQTDKARRDDLKRIVKYGIPGTYMPSFLLLEEEELNLVVEFVRWLAMRGEFEKRMVDELEGDYSEDAVADRVKGGETREEIDAALQAYLTDEFPATVSSIADDLAEAWNRAEEEEAVVLPEKPRNPDDPAGESRERGRQLYLSERAKCASCHGPRGLGDGPQTEAFQKIPGTNNDYPEPGLFDAWDHRITPRDLNSGIYRGGRRPLDLYRRVYAGIKGTPMPAFGGTVLKDEEIWDLVNYVLSIPYDGPTPVHGQAAEEVATAPATQRGRQ